MGKKLLSIEIDASLDEEIEKAKLDYGFTKTVIIERGIKMFLQYIKDVFTKHKNNYGGDN